MATSTYARDDVRITVRLPAPLCERLDEIARLNRASRSEVVRHAVERHCGIGESSATCYDLVSETGLIGAAHDGPEDLSADPKHMEGFGRD